MKPGGQRSHIMLIQEVIPAHLAQEIIRYFDTSDAKRKGQVYNREGQIEVNEEKISTDLDLDQKFTGYEELESGIQAAFGEYRKCFLGLSNRDFVHTGLKVQKYDMGQGQFKWHCDATTSATYHLQVAMVLYLNTVKEGGETSFFDQNLSFKPVVGNVLFFPTFWTHPHCGQIPNSEDKYIISSFFMTNT